MSNIPKMGQLPTPVHDQMTQVHKSITLGHTELSCIVSSTPAGNGGDVSTAIVFRITWW